MNEDVTEILLAWKGGDRDAPNRLFPLVYDELRRVAHRQVASERRDLTLNTTAVVHEAYLRLVDQTQVAWADRGHFLAVAARVMRHVVIDYARRHRAAKRGGDGQRVDLDAVTIAATERASILIALDDALVRLAKVDERLMRVVECRFFGGLTDEETGQALGVNPRTVRRDWLKAKAWLLNALEG